MKTGFRGTFVISWSQTELDGQAAAPLRSLRLGATWSWDGEALRVDGPAGVLPLGDAEGAADLRRRASFSVRRLLKAVEADTARLDTIEVEAPLFETFFTVTDGRATWTVSLIETVVGQAPLCMFLGEIPPRLQDLWVVSHNVDLAARDQSGDIGGGVICFVSGTMIETEDGPKPVEEVAEGTRVQTVDNGCQEVLWTARRRITGARLYAMPNLAPVRLQSDALGVEIPDAPLLVSPDHRILVRGPAAEALFNAPEVLVAARDLVNDRDILVERGLRQLTYHHLLMEQHQIVLANGVAAESFHPASAALATMGEDDRGRLFDRMPALQEDVQAYGGYARRMLRQSEAAILRHDAA